MKSILMLPITVISSTKNSSVSSIIIWLKINTNPKTAIFRFNPDFLPGITLNKQVKKRFLYYTHFSAIFYIFFGLPLLKGMPLSGNPFTL